MAFLHLLKFSKIKCHASALIRERAYFFFPNLWQFLNHLHFKGLRNFNRWSIVAHVSWVHAFKHARPPLLLPHKNSLLSSPLSCVFKMVQQPPAGLSVQPSQVVPLPGRWKALCTPVRAPAFAFTLMENNFKMGKEQTQWLTLNWLEAFPQRGLFRSHVVCITDRKGT